MSEEREKTGSVGTDESGAAVPAPNQAIPTERPKMKLGHVCPECGTAGWMHRDADRQRDELRWKRSDVEKLARENGLLRYELDEAREADKRKDAWLRTKVAKQAKVIAALERKLRERGQRPYEDTPASEAPR